MKFRFCGDQDCPDWLLAEVTVLSRMSSVRMKLISKQLLTYLTGGEMNYDKIEKFTTSTRVTLDRADIKALLASLTFIFTNATKFKVEGDILQTELEQLGLPSDICKSICRSYRGSQAELYTVLAAKTLKIGGLNSIDWRVDYIFASRLCNTVEEPTVSITLEYPDTQKSTPAKNNQVSFECNGKKLLLVLHELQQARQAMNIDFDKTQ